jgi:hypothetical protein
MYKNTLPTIYEDIIYISSFNFDYLHYKVLHSFLYRKKYNKKLLKNR